MLSQQKKKRFQPYLSEGDQQLLIRAAAVALECPRPTELLRLGGLMLARAVLVASEARGGLPVSVFDDVLARPDRGEPATHEELLAQRKGWRDG